MSVSPYTPGFLGTSVLCFSVSFYIFLYYIFKSWNSSMFSCLHVHHHSVENVNHVHNFNYDLYCSQSVIFQYTPHPCISDLCAHFPSWKSQMHCKTNVQNLVMIFFLKFCCLTSFISTIIHPVIQARKLIPWKGFICSSMSYVQTTFRELRTLPEVWRCHSQ